MERFTRERDALLDLARFLAGESGGGVLGETLERLLAGTLAPAGAAFSVGGAELELVADRGTLALPGVPAQGGASAVTAALLEVARHTLEARKPIGWSEIDAAPLDASARDALALQGFQSLLAVPALHQRDVLAIFVLLARDPRPFDATATSFAETAAHVAALAIERDRRAEREAALRDEWVAASHMASLGLLTATVAQELRGPVAALAVQVEEERKLIEDLTTLAGTGPLVEAVATDLAELGRDVAASVERVRATLAQLSGLSLREAAPERVDLAQVVAEALGMARATLARRHIMLVEQCEPGCTTLGLRHSLGQVVLNLVFNAADACEASQRPAPTVTVRTEVEGRRVVLSVEDTGPGVPADRIQAIFAPFFTTKARDHGTGLGLKICSDVATAHHGHIEVQNLPGGGASFRVMLPHVTGATSRPSPPREAARSTAAGARARGLDAASAAPAPHAGSSGPTAASAPDDPRRATTRPPHRPPREPHVDDTSERADSERVAREAPTQPPRRGPDSIGPSAAPEAPLRILIVDDDEMFARTMRRALRPHDVRLAGSAGEAEAFLLDDDYQPHLVVCDLGLPGFNGDVLHARVRARRPAVAERFVFVTGGACSKAEADYLRASGCPTHLKPVAAGVIVAAARAKVPTGTGPSALPTLGAPDDEPTLPQGRARRERQSRD